MLYKYHHLTVVALLLLASSTLWAYDISDLSKLQEDFCQNHLPTAKIRQILQDDSRQQLSFRNQGGLINGGVCWWHSRFTRNTAYLAAFAPELPNITHNEAVDIIKRLRKGKEVVVIPGYQNIAEFSYYFAKEIQSELESWQKVDGMIGQQWLVGLWGSSEISAKKMQKRMDTLYREVVKKNRVVYQMLQIKGIDSHAWLVVDMEKLGDGGYHLTVIDSNYPQDHQQYYYHPGMTSFHHRGFGSFVPYTGKNRELKRMERVISKLCR